MAKWRFSLLPVFDAVSAWAAGANSKKMIICTTPRTIIRVFALTVILFLPLAISVPSAPAASVYSFKDSRCGSPSQLGYDPSGYVDPITIWIRDTQNQGLGTMLGDLVSRGWGDNRGGSRQWLWSQEYLCDPMVAQRAEPCGGRPSWFLFCSRYHARFFRVLPPLPGWFSDPHHEDYKGIDCIYLGCYPTTCVHAVDANGPQGSGFEQARDRMVNMYSDTRILGPVFWGNTQNFKQCDGGWAGAEDGELYRIDFGIPN